MRPKLLVTDLDNTLYDWVTFFGTSIEALLVELTALTKVPRERLEAEFRAVHRRYGNSEQPFAVLELPSVVAAAGTSDPTRVAEFVAGPMKAFDDARRRTLRLYPDVESTLEDIAATGIPIVGHTEAMILNSYYRLVKLGIDHWFRHLYSRKGSVPEHPFPTRDRRLHPKPGFVREFPSIKRKPSPAVIRDICRGEGIRPEECLYIGDSLSRDVMMAKDAGAVSVWARYGTVFAAENWNRVVSVTHWTPEDVQRESRLRERSASVRPDFVVDGFAGILDVLEIMGGRLTPNPASSVVRDSPRSPTG